MSAFSKAFKAVRNIALPALGAAVGIPPSVTTSVLGIYNQARATSAALMGGGPVVGPGGGMMEVGRAGAGQATVPSTGGMFQPLMRWLVGPRGIARNAVGKIVGVMRGTALFRNKRVIALAKQIGIEGAAIALGITIAEVAEMFVAEAGKKRRTRGITGRDIKCTRRTLGKIRSVQRMIGLPRITRARAKPSVAVRCD